MRVISGSAAALIMFAIAAQAHAEEIALASLPSTPVPGTSLIGAPITSTATAAPATTAPGKRVAAIAPLETSVTDVTSTADPTPRWPREVIARPATYPAGLATAGFDVGAPAGQLGGATDVRLVAGYGITDRVEINAAGYGFSSNQPGKGTFEAALGAHLGMVGEDLDFGLKAGSGYNLEAGNVTPLLLGVTGTYNITAKLQVIWPGEQISVGVAGDPALVIAAPVALGYQATPLVFLQLDTTLGSFGAGAPTQLLLTDTTPVALTAFVNVAPTVDLFAAVSADLTPPDAPGNEDDAMPAPQLTDTINVLVGARYYFGRK